EIRALMTLLKRFLASERKEMVENDIQLRVLGQTHRLPEDVQEGLTDVMVETRRNKGMCLCLALSYGARSEIVDAARKLARQVREGRMSPEDFTEELFSQNLYTQGIPDPELLIRTSGEYRISNFLLWQIAYSEIFVTPTLWPDFTREEFIGILKDFQRRERRFGRVSEK
ncbi:MAG: polyprenyl diphosphate synthase, partial [Desulfosalsimonas sp.]